jgi:DNA modification methylase
MVLAETVAKMRPIHPFPARMAPDAIAKWLDELPSASLVVDPMCGSGVVLRQALARGHNVKGFDIDPLAVLMSKVWTSKESMVRLPAFAAEIATHRGVPKSYTSMPVVNACSETREFIEYWFAEPQRRALARISISLFERREMLPRHILHGLLVSLSRTIVTKQSGASLAWDVSHSRPHRMRDSNAYDVEAGFVRAAEKLTETLRDDRMKKGSVSVVRRDCRSLGVSARAADAIITSPPYLNAIDYLRGHKLALVWMGYTIPQLRALRAKSIGTENTGRGRSASRHAEEDAIMSAFPELDGLPVRQRGIVAKYANDSQLVLKEMKRVLKPKGRLVVVLADSVVRGIEVKSSEIYAKQATRVGFNLISREVREIPHDKRYLPINSKNKSIAGRMRSEIVQVFEA